MIRSAGLLIFRKRGVNVEVLLCHPGGPFWAKKDTWSIPKGEVAEDESLEQALEREFVEETSFDIPQGERINLGEAKQSSSKTNYVWAVEGDMDTSKFACRSTFEMEWPPKSGKKQEFPENDRVAWFELSQAKQKVFKAQQVFIDRLSERLNITQSDAPFQQSLL